MALPLVYRFQGYRGVAFSTQIVAADDSTSAWFNAAAPWAVAECQVYKDGGAGANITAAPTRIGATPVFTFTLTATEMDADRVAVTLIDSASGAGTPSDLFVIVDTQRYWNPSIMRANLIQSTPSTTSIQLDASANATDDYYNEQSITIVSGTGIGQTRMITDYTGASKTANINRAWTTNPAANDVFVIQAAADVWGQLEGAQPSGATSTNATFRSILQYLKRRFYNKVTQTSALQQVYQDDNATVLTSMTASDDGTTQTKGQST